MISRSVLIVEDLTLSLVLLKRQLLALYPNWQIHTEGDAMAALEVFQDVRHDIVFIDIQLPKVSGITLLKQLRDLVGDDHPIIAYTALDDIQSVLREGFTMVLQKPAVRKDVSKVLTHLEYRGK